MFNYVTMLLAQSNELITVTLTTGAAATVGGVLLQKFLLDKKPPTSGSGNGGGKFVSEKFCDERHRNTDRRLDSMDIKLDTIIGKLSDKE